MKIRIIDSSASDKNARKMDGTGLFVAEGYSCVRNEPGARMRAFGKCDTGMVVLCRGEEKTSSYLLRQFQQWFQDEFPQLLHPFSTDVVKRYWQSMLAVLSDAERGTLELSILLVHCGQYVFCGAGDFTVYEYSLDTGKYRKWYTGRERKKLDYELGIAHQEEQLPEFYMKHRKISENVLFLLLPRPVCLEFPKKIKRKRNIKKMTEILAEEVSCAIAVCCEKKGGFF